MVRTGLRTEALEGLRWRHGRRYQTELQVWGTAWGRCSDYPLARQAPRHLAKRRFDSGDQRPAAAEFKPTVFVGPVRRNPGGPFVLVDFPLEAVLAGHCAHAHDTHDEEQDEENDSDNQYWHTIPPGDGRLCSEGTHRAVTAITLDSDKRVSVSKQTNVAGETTTNGDIP